MIVGLTGGIGVGKSTVAHLLRVLGVPVYNSDDRAKQLMNEDDSLVQALKNHFGESLYENNKLNTAFLAAIIFSNLRELQFINSLVHPFVKKDFDVWKEQHKQFSIIVQEAAVLMESNAYKFVDYILVVESPLELRIKRVMKRDACSREQVLERISNQWSDEARAKYAHKIIYCDDQQFVIPQVREWLSFCSMDQ